MEKRHLYTSQWTFYRVQNSFFPIREGDFLRLHQKVSLTIENNYSRWTQMVSKIQTTTNILKFNVTMADGFIGHLHWRVLTNCEGERKLAPGASWRSLQNFGIGLKSLLGVWQHLHHFRSYYYRKEFHLLSVQRSPASSRCPRQKSMSPTPVLVLLGQSISLVSLEVHSRSSRKIGPMPWPK